MLKIIVKYLGVSNQKSSHEPEEVELLDSSNIEQLMNQMNERLEFKIDVLIKSAVFLVNKSKANIDTILKDGDEVLILYALGGG